MDRYDFDQYAVLVSDNGNRVVKAKDGSFHMMFRKSDGLTAKWGRTMDDDPTHCPWGNEIADIEIATACSGIRDKDGNRAPCAFCAPAGTMIQTPNGDVAIEQIVVGDYVIGYDFQNNRPQIQKVKETYIREYSGELICIETENGKIIKVTPNHPIMLLDGRQVLAKDLKDTDEVVTW